ncbi:hypothetical protein RhiJN_08107 [Ceratobasidium sp. AG-Ba]|nr:hypothetical protein RhiJN_08107 [Ceratobasidium sp. AG-Ba]QRW08863.1 hypothetical protein RhiLY_07862 [Ceratobasidium sp. AG-Ba]
MFPKLPTIPQHIILNQSMAIRLQINIHAPNVLIKMVTILTILGNRGLRESIRQPVDSVVQSVADRDVVPEFCRRLSPAGGFWRKFLIPAPAPSPAARSRIPGGIPSGLQELQEWRSSCY